MKIRDLLAVESVQLNGSASSKTDAINQVIDLMNKSGKISNLEAYRKGVFEREEEGTTGIGMGIAILHCKADSVKEAGLAVYVYKNGVNFETLDGAPVKIIFLIAAPDTEDNVHLEVLSKLSVMLLDENFTKNLINADSIDEFLNIIDKTEECDFNMFKDESYIKSSDEADTIIVACDTNVPMDRFDGKKEFATITATASLIKQIGDIAFGFMLPIFAGFIAMSIADRPGIAVGFVGGSIANNGTSGVLGALVAGFLGGYIVLGLRKVFNKLPDSLDGLKPVLLYPLIGIFLTGTIMQFVVEPPIGALNILINNGLKELSGTSAVLLGSLLGGMVLPIAIALATHFFKDKFTEDQRKAGVKNYIMGLYFVKEGAIPFADADPFSVIPYCVIGSAISGAFSMAFHCTLMAPRGGIFVVPAIGIF